MTSSLRSKFSRGPKRVFYLSGTRLTAYHWRAGRLIEALLFQAGEGLAEFAAYLEEAPNVVSFLLLDMVEEEYRRDTVPHVFGNDRRDIVKFRAERHFRETPYWYAALQGREKEGRRDDRVLYLGVTTPGMISPWVELIEQAKVPLAGIYSLPVLSASLLPGLGAGTGETLLVSLQSGGGLRQSFFLGQDLKLSRLAHLPVLEGAQLAESIVDEIEKLRRYLNSLRLLARDTRLQVYILGHGEILRDLENMCADDPRLDYRLVDTAEQAGRLGMTEDLVTSSCDSLFARLLLARLPGNHYASASQLRYFRLHRMRNSMLAASVALVLAGVLGGGLELVGGLVNEQRSQAAGQQADFYRVRYEEARAGLPPAPAEPHDLEAAVKTVQTLAEHRASPLELLSVLSLALTAYPDLRVEDVQWAVSADPDAPLGQASVPAVGEGRPKRAAVGQSAQGLYDLAMVRGRVTVYGGNYRQALEQVRGFAERLKGMDGVQQVTIVSLPLNVSSNERLRGDLEEQSGSDRAGYAVRVVYRKEHEAV